MKKYRYLLMALLSFNVVNAQEFTITKAAPFDILQSTHESCQKDVMKLIEEDAINQYMGCTVDISMYDIKVTTVESINSSVTHNECSEESRVNVSSKFLDENEYYRGSNGVLCSGYDVSIEQDDTPWSSFELGLIIATSGAQSSLEMGSSDSKIYYKYDQVPMIGFNLSYLYKLFNSQYVGGKLFYASSSETYSSSTSTTKERNDGNPAITRTGLGAFYGYRYHAKTDFTLGLNLLSDSVTRTYTNNTYTASVSGVAFEAGVGYLILPYLKLWGSLGSGVTFGASFVY